MDRCGLRGHIPGDDRPLTGGDGQDADGAGLFNAEPLTQFAGRMRDEV